MNYLLCCLSLLSFNLFHGEPIAEYYLQSNGKHLELKFIIDEEQLKAFDWRADCDLQGMTALCTFQYLQEHTKVKINGEEINFELHGSFTQQGHLIVFSGADLHGIKIEDISIHTDSFYEFDGYFKNRMILDVSNFQGSYLLDKQHRLIHLLKE